MKTAALPIALPNPTQPLADDWHGPLHGAFHQRATATPERLAVVDEAERWTYEELATRSAQLAHHLISQGLQPQDVVAVHGQRGASLVWALLGILEAGAAYLILDPSYPVRHLTRCLRVARPRSFLEIEGTDLRTVELQSTLDKLAITDRLSLPGLTEARERGFLAHYPTSPPELSWTAAHRAYLAFTSGTTGEPKAVIGTHGPPAHYLRWVTKTFDLTAEDRFSLLSGLGHDPLLRDIFTPLSLGATLEIPASSDLDSAEQLTVWLGRRQITVTHLTPTRIRSLVDTVPLPQPLPLRLALVGGEVLTAADVSLLEGLAPAVQCVNVYGTTETPQAISTYVVPKAGNASRDQRARIPIGSGIEGVQLLILDRSHNGGTPQLADVGQTGEICVRTRYLAAGYLDDDELTRQQFQTNPFTGDASDRIYRTGDLGRYTSCGEVEILGRLDRQINLRGVRIEPGELEYQLERHPEVHQAVMIAVAEPDDRPGSETVGPLDRESRLIVYYTATEAAPNATELRRFLTQRLPAANVPALLRRLDALPLSVNGKIDTTALQRLDLDLEAHPSDRVGFRSPVENRLSNIWCEVLGRKAVARNDDFFALGGHSLNATRVTSRIRQQFGIELSPRALFDHPTVARLAEMLADASTATLQPDRTPPLTADASTGVSPLPLSFAQQRLWFLDQLAPGHPAYSLPTIFKLEGEIDHPALQRALNALVVRHEVLRTTFPSHHGEPIQQIAPRLTAPLPQVDLRPLDDNTHRVARQLAIDSARRGFELARGPLLRACLLQLEERRYWLLLDLHHIVTDGWSQGVLFRDLGIFYRRFIGVAAEPLPELPVQYADFAVWQRAWLRDHELERRLADWRQRLTGAPEILQLTTDRPRPAVQSYRGATLPLAVSPRLSGQLSTLGGRQGVSPFMILVTAFMAWLSRVTGQDDVVIGTPIAHRDRREIEDLIGFFVNMLALRVELSQAPRFIDLLAQVRETALDAYSTQDLPFEKLVDDLAPERDLGRHPIFQITLALHNTELRNSESHNRPTASLHLPGLDVQPVPPPFQAVRFDLEVHLWDVDDGSGHSSLQGEAIYNADLFDATTIQRGLHQFDAMLEGLLDANPWQPNARWHDLPLLTRGQRHQVMLEWNDTATAHPDGVCLHHLIAASAERHPDTIAVARADHQLSYRHLLGSARDMANRLRALGAGPESRIGICLERGLDLVICLMATLEAGSAYVPLDPDYPENRLALMVDDANIRILITEDRKLDVAARQNVSIVTPGDLQRNTVCEPQPAGVADLADDHAAYVLFTSGSTGRPKGIAVTHRAIVHHMHWMQREFPLDDSDCLLQKTPFSFDASVWEFWAPLLVGGRLTLAQPGGHRDPGYLSRTIDDFGVTVLQVVPSLLVLLLEHSDLRRCRTLRRVYCGGEALSSELVRRYHEQGPPAELLNVYGPSEGTIHAASKRLASTDNDHRVPLGRPIDNVRVHLLDKASRGGAPVAVGVPGHLHLAGAGLARGYLDRPRWTAASFVPDPFTTHPGHRLYATGDLARLSSGGELEFLDRIDHQLKLRGVRLELGEIEAVLVQHPAVREGAVIPPQDDQGQLVAFVVATLPAPTTEEAVEWQRERIAQWQMLHDGTYDSASVSESQERSPVDPTLDFTGWNSSYTDRPIPLAEMQEWLDATVERIVDLAPKHVLEIGCGSGLLLFRIAPTCSRYLATDFSRVVLQTLQQHIAARPELSRVELLERAADNFDGWDSRPAENDRFDTVLLNSVVQYFPGVDYLLTVLRAAIDLTAPGGRIFVGDVRSLPRLDAYCISVELFRASPNTSIASLQERARQRREREEELVLDPAFFSAFCREHPRVSAIRILPKAGRARNELTRFRYDVVLELDTPQPEPRDVVDPATLLLSTPVSLPALHRTLVDGQPVRLELRDLPDPRVADDLRLQKHLATESDSTVGELRQALAQGAGAGLEPEDLRELAAAHGYAIELDGMGLAQDGTYRAVLHRLGAASQTSATAVTSQPTPRPWPTYANDPLRQHGKRRLTESLTQHLRSHLPQAMIPTGMVVLDDLPHQPNGKIDRRELGRIAVLDLPSTSRDGQAAPRTASEHLVMDVWREVLGLTNLGIHDNFFELGGHSLLAAQVVARLREGQDGVELALQGLFENPTVAELAGLVEQAAGPLDPPIERMRRDRPLPLSFSQQRLWFLHQLQPTSPAYHMPELYHLTGRLDASLLAGCWNTILLRHETLRTAFPDLDGRASQYIHSFVPRLLPIIDLQGLDPAAWSRETHRLTGREAARPFDLAAGPLVRLLLVRWREDEHALFLNLHHIVSDGLSQTVLYRELRALYLNESDFSELVSAKPAPAGPPPRAARLPELPVQYVDYAIWQRQRMSGERLAELTAAWREMLGDGVPALELPTDRSRPVGQPSHRGAAHHLKWPAESVEALRARGRESGASLYMTLLASVMAWLHVISGQPRLFVGSPVANRDRTEIENAIGCFVNTLVLCGTIRDDPSFSHHLRAVRRTTLAAFASRELPFEKLVEALQPERDAGRNPLFQVGLTLLDDPQQGPRLPRIASRPLDLGFQAARLDLECLLWPAARGNGMRGKLIYRPDLFDASTIARWARQLETLLRSGARDPTLRLSRHQRFPTAERHQLLIEWNNTEAAIHRENSLHQLIARRAAGSPERVAVMAENHSVTYRELHRRSERLAERLRSRSLPKDAPIALCMERSIEMVIGLLAILEAGHAYLPLDPEDSGVRLARLLADSQAQLVLVDQNSEQGLETRRVEQLVTKQLGEQIAEPQDDLSRPWKTVTGDADSAAYMIYTSGSTGRPKLTVNSHRAIVNRLTWMQATFHLDAEDRVLQKTPIIFDVSVWELFWPLISGATLVMSSPGGHRDPRYLQTAIEQHRITTLHFVPAMLQAFLADLELREAPARQQRQLPTVRRVISSGEALSDDLKGRCLTQLCGELHNLYGPTEAAVDVSHQPCRTDDTVTIGRPIANTRLYIADRWLALLPRQTSGELLIAGQQVAQGYQGAPRLTAVGFVPDAFSERPGARLYRTGDIASWSTDGRIDYLGRRDHQVKIRGVRIELHEVEAALEGLPTVARAVARVVTQLGGHDLGPRLIAYLVPTTPGHHPKLTELREPLRQRLPEVMIPSQLIALATLPVTSNGKLDRHRLPAPTFEVVEKKDHIADPRTVTEQALADIWRRVLAIDRISIHDNFFELGGHSLLATQVTARIWKELRRELPVRSLFEAPTIAAISRLLEDSQVVSEDATVDTFDEFEEGLL